MLINGINERGKEAHIIHAPAINIPFIADGVGIYYDSGSRISHRIELRPAVKYLQTPEKFLAERWKRFVEHNEALEDAGGGDL